MRPLPILLAIVVVTLCGACSSTDLATLTAPGAVNGVGAPYGIVRTGQEPLVEAADLSLSTVADRRSVKVGEHILFTITLTNLGPAHATDVIFGDPLPEGLNLVSFTCDKGTVSGSFCTVDNVPPGTSVTGILVATPIVNPAHGERKFTNTAHIGSANVPDPNDFNNRASVETHILGKLP